jgi:uncharacterized protein (TIGR00730 family)
MMLRSICVFCGSSVGNPEIYAHAAEELGCLLARRGIELVYGGGKTGLMGVLADACLGGGGKVMGIIPQALVAKEVAHAGLTELRIVGSMHERKAMMADLADAFIALPGGYGTWDEFCEVLTWSQLGLHQKACAILNIGGYYDPFLGMADRALADGFVRAAHREMVITDTDPARLLDRLETYGVPRVEKWIRRADV